MTICKKCTNHIQIEDNDIWYNHLCGAAPLPIGLDPVTGNLRSISNNDLGMEYTSEHLYDYCRNINDGDCKLFKSI